MGEGEAAPGVSFRDRMHSLLRTSILDAAWEAAAETDWRNVRMVDIAETVGVSRQTVYNEFGSKADVARALFEREVATFQHGLVASMEGADSVPDAAHRLLTWLLSEIRAHAMVQSMLRDARDQRSEGEMLRMLTVNAHLFAVPIRTMLLEEFSRRWPGTNPQSADLAIDLTIRWTLTQVIVPSDFEEAEVIDRIVEMITVTLVSGSQRSASSTRKVG